MNEFWVGVVGGLVGGVCGTITGLLLAGRGHLRQLRALQQEKKMLRRLAAPSKVVTQSALENEPSRTRIHPMFPRRGGNTNSIR